jgi:hypothetical protein
MTEKKTFKNSEGVLVYQNSRAPDSNEYWCFAGKMFPSDEWDMEVTFTKKVQPEVGGTAMLDNIITIFTIIAVSNERVWLQDPANPAQNCVRRFDQLRNVKPWQPV